MAPFPNLPGQMGFYSWAYFDLPAWENAKQLYEGSVNGHVLGLVHLSVRDSVPGWVLGGLAHLQLSELPQQSHLGIPLAQFA
jgi:hypothetical protein